MSDQSNRQSPPAAPPAAAPTQRKTCPRCNGWLHRNRQGEYITVTCVNCGHNDAEIYSPQRNNYAVRLPPQPPPPPLRPVIPEPPERPAGKVRPPRQLSVSGAELDDLLKRYCDLRRQGHVARAIAARLGQPQYAMALLLAAAQERGLPGSEAAAGSAVKNWLLERHDAGAAAAAARECAWETAKAQQALQQALNAAAAAVTPERPYVAGPYGKGGRISWKQDGKMRHRGLTEPLPADLDRDDAQAQCRGALIQLLDRPEDGPLRDQAYAMLQLAEAGFHAFDAKAGRELARQLKAAGLDEDAQRVVIKRLHPAEGAARLLLERCGIRANSLSAGQARALSRRMSGHMPADPNDQFRRFPPAVTRQMIVAGGRDPDTYYVISPENRIPLPEPAELERCRAALLATGCGAELAQHALDALGVPKRGHHPTGRSRKKRTAATAADGEDEGE